MTGWMFRPTSSTCISLRFANVFDARIPGQLTLLTLPDVTLAHGVTDRTLDLIFLAHDVEE